MKWQIGRACFLLPGMDVARKAVILARQCGVAVELSDVALESLTPAALRDIASPDDFLARLPEVHKTIQKRADAITPPLFAILQAKDGDSAHMRPCNI